MKFLNPKIIIINLLLVLYMIGNTQTNYYISSIHGNDANSGKSASTPWKSISKLQAVVAELRAGDKVYFERGSVWYNVNLTLNGVKGTISSPIVFSSYGSGALPLICGSSIIQSFQNNGNIWSKYSGSFPVRSSELKNIAGLFINDRFYSIGRTPNTGYYTSPTKNTKSFVDDPDVNWPINQWQGGQIVARTESWAWDQSYISSSSAQRYTVEGFVYNLHHDQTYYFIQNHVNTLDLQFEWAYNNQTLSIYSTTDVNQLKVEIPVISTILALTNCENLKFENINLTKSNLNGFSISNSNFITISDCRISYIGGSGIKIENSGNFTLQNSYFNYCFSNSILMDGNGQSLIQNNDFKKCGIEIGLCNGTARNRSTISSYVAYETATIQYNRFDSVMIAYQGHYSQKPMYFQYNIIEDYGMVLGDYGAIYLEGESIGTQPKYVKNNIIINGHSDLQSFDNRGIGAYSHAIYLDYDCANVQLENNTIINCNLGVIFNRVRNNTVRNNTIVNPGTNMVDAWKAAVAWDQNTGLLFEYLDYNNFSYNQMVLTNPACSGFLLHDVTIGGNTMNYNSYIQPFKENGDVITKVHDFTSVWNYNLSEWFSMTGQEGNSNYGNSQTKYNSSLGITQDQFIKVYYNASQQTKFQTLNAKYIDKDGAVYSGGINIQPYSSVVLFYKGVADIPNNAPIINNQEFWLEESVPLPEFIGKVVATDPDPGQNLTYSIIEGNSNNYFRINSETGDIYLTVQELDFEATGSYSLRVRVTDDGMPSQSQTAYITIHLVGSANAAPLIENQEFQYQSISGASLIIARILAYDPNGDELTFEITGGDISYFTINSQTGDLSIVSTDLGISVPTTFNLTVTVKDDGSPQLSANSVITIHYIPQGFVLYIDPEASQNGNGSYSSPYNTLSGLELKSGYNYLIKRNTTLQLETLMIGVDSILIGSYGTGELPLIESQSSGSIISSIDHDHITIRDLHIKAENALSNIYFLGPGSMNIYIINCKIEGADYGIRFINTGNASVEKCRFLRNIYGAYVIGKTTSFNYNVFSSNTFGLSISSSESISDIFNNVFYDNDEAIMFNGIQISLYNNIFNLLYESDRAINISALSINADQNIYYPEQPNFYSIANTNFHTLKDLNDNAGIELNSLSSSPCFINASEGDFTLAYNSPAIDAGKYVGLLHDINGSPIPVGDAPDIGIIEYNSDPTYFNKPFEDNTTATINVFPNPVIAEIYLSTSPYLSNGFIEIYDLIGNNYGHFNTENLVEEAGKLLINVTNLKHGLYILRIYNDEISGAARFLKQ